MGALGRRALVGAWVVQAVGPRDDHCRERFQESGRDCRPLAWADAKETWDAQTREWHPQRASRQRERQFEADGRPEAVRDE